MATPLEELSADGDGSNTDSGRGGSDEGEKMAMRYDVSAGRYDTNSRPGARGLITSYFGGNTHGYARFVYNCRSASQQLPDQRAPHINTAALLQSKPASSDVQPGTATSRRARTAPAPASPHQSGSGVHADVHGSARGDAAAEDAQRTQQRSDVIVRCSNSALHTHKQVRSAHQSQPYPDASARCRT